MRGWMYLLSGTASYIISPLVWIWTPLPIGIQQVDPLVFPKSVLLLIFFNVVITAVSWHISSKAVCKLFKTVTKKNDIIQNIHIFDRPFLFTYVAIISFSLMSCLYIWDNLRALLEPGVFPVDLYLYVAIVFFALGLIFEYLAIEASNVSNVN